MFAFAPYGQGFESWSGLVFFSMYAIEILFPVKIELSDFCLSAQILSTLFSESNLHCSYKCKCFAM